MQSIESINSRLPEFSQRPPGAAPRCNRAPEKPLPVLWRGRYARTSVFAVVPCCVRVHKEARHHIATLETTRHDARRLLLSFINWTLNEVRARTLVVTSLRCQRKWVESTHFLPPYTG
jgi:hypothetical protein